ncbi:MAG TPA: DUF3631 domain-containing protein [Micropepsaceae bacterium]|nr:DUF3631 domain-containing protein [Micropepsaceae bacterium]
MDQPDTSTPPPDLEDEESADEAEFAELAQSLDVTPEELQQMMEEDDDGELSGLEIPGKSAAPHRPSRRVSFPTPEPWPEPVDAGELLDRVTRAIAFHVHMDGHLALVAALWAMHTHVLAQVTRTPRLVIYSGCIASGKTTLLSVLSCLVFRPLTICAAKSNSLIEAVSHRPTLLIDDAAALLQGNPDARALIRNGCCRSGARLLRMRRGSQPEAIDLFTPIAVAFDGDIPPVFAGRAIGIPLEPLPFGKTAGPLSPEARDNLSQIGRMIARWAADHAPANLAPVVHGAKGECHDPNWQPLLAIAAAIGDEWKTRAIEAMKCVRGVSATSELERLLADIRPVIHDVRAGNCPFTGPDRKPIRDADRVRSIDLIDQLCSAQSSRWGEHGRNGQPVTPQALARILANANIRPGMLRFHTGDDNAPGVSFRDRGYLFTQFTQAFERYLREEGPIATPEAA